MKRHLLVGICLLATVVSGCIREPGCEIVPSDGNLQIILNWPETEKNPPGVFTSSYSSNGNIPVNDFLPPEGGRLYIPQGIYNILVYSNTTETIDFRNMDSFNNAEAFVGKDIQPDELFAGNIRNIQVEGTASAQTIEIEMSSLVKSYPFTFKGITGIENVSQIRVYVSGISTVVSLTEPDRRLPTDSIRCLFNRTSDGFQGSFRSFGHGSDSTLHYFTVRFESGEMSKTYTYDVTEMLNLRGRIDITEKLEFKPIGNGGFQPGVDDWEDDSAIVPL